MAEIPHIFDRRALAMKKARAARRGGENFLAEEAARGLAHRLMAVNRTFVAPVVLDVPAPAFAILKQLAGDWTAVTFGESERLPLEPQSHDLIVSILSLHAVNDLPGALIQIRRALKPDGLFMAALFAGDTLRELRESFAAGEEQITGGASPRVSPFADVRDLGALLQRAGFALPVADTERTTVRYRQFTTLANDLRAAGETNVLDARPRKTLRRDVLAASLAHYGENHAEDDGRLRATFEIAYLTGWAPHESQQKPLRPGSAKTRLADALGTIERNAGDTTPTRRG
ncbi:MAG TPA: methyltransferase domain-containing protein [Rhizomicrobium sp.]|nr:methyltransferase domain-containing protein [Rhizomicrobium sp.]